MSEGLTKKIKELEIAVQRLEAAMKRIEGPVSMLIAERMILAHKRTKDNDDEEEDKNENSP